MTTVYGTDMDDTLIGSELGGAGLNIDGLGGNDYVELGPDQVFVSGAGADTIIGSEGSGYGLWFQSSPVEVNLAEGWAVDEFGDEDTLVDMSVVHMSGAGGTVIGSDYDERIFYFGGNADLNLGGGFDVVNFWEIDSAGYRIRQFENQVVVSNSDYSATLTGVEELHFADRSFQFSFSQDSERRFLRSSDELFSFTETEFSGGWWYAGEYNEPQLVWNGIQAPIVVDLGNDGDHDVIAPSVRGYRTGIDTRSKFHVFENDNGSLQYSASLSEKTAYISSAGRSSEIYIESLGVSAYVSVNIDTAVEDESRTDIPWRLGDLYIARLDTLENVTLDLIPEAGLPLSSYVDRATAVDAHGMAVGDINADGLDDIYVGNSGEPFALLQSATGRFELVTHPVWTEFINDFKEPTLADPTSAYPLDFDLDDFNGDGYDDLLVGRGHGTTLSRILFNDGAGDFSVEQSTVLPASYYGPSNTLHMKTFSEDFDSDGDVDLVILQSRNEPYYSGNYLQYLSNDGSGNFIDETATRLMAPELYPDTELERLHWTSYWQVFDIDSDGDIDITGQRVSGSRDPVIWTNDGSGFFEYETISGVGDFNIAYADFDDDGEIESLGYVVEWQTNESQEHTDNTFTLYELVDPALDAATSRAFDLDSNAGTVAKILGAVFGAEQVSNKEYAGIGLSLMDSGAHTFESLGALAMGVLAPVDNTEICEILWENVVGSPAEVLDIAPFVSMLDNQDLSVGELVVLAANTAQNLENIDFVGLQSTGLEYTPVG